MPSREPPETPQDLEATLQARLPEDLVSPEGFEVWYSPLSMEVMIAVVRLHEQVGSHLADELPGLRRREGASRPVWSLTGTDDRSLLKSSASVRSKLGRELREKEKQNRLLKGRLSHAQVEDVVRAFPDLGRFRVVCDFLDDLELARRVLIPEPRRGVLGRYPLVGRIKDYLHDLDLRQPARGHRAVQFAAEVEEAGTRLRVEVQLMTRLQDIWDRRNHPIYEWSRAGGKLPARLQVSDIALAEALYLLDLQASRNWRSFLALKRRRERTR